MGSTRVVIEETGTILGKYDYDAWGETLWESNPMPRLSFIDKERDAESQDHNFGVRQYSPKYGGRFGSIDMMWEKYRSLSPYQYSANNPLILVDPTGMVFEYSSNQMQSLYNDYYAVASANVKAKLDELANEPNVIYRIEEWNSNGTSENSYDFTNDKVLLRIGSLNPNQVGALADELTHAYQFQTGEIGYMLDNQNVVRSVGYDVDDEIASKDAFIAATTAYNTANPGQAPLPLGPAEMQYQAASDKGAYLGNHHWYGPSFAPNGRQSGVAIRANLGNSYNSWLLYQQGNGVRDFAYRENINGNYVTRLGL